MREQVIEHWCYTVTVMTKFYRATYSACPTLWEAKFLLSPTFYALEFLFIQDFLFNPNPGHK